MATEIEIVITCNEFMCGKAIEFVREKTGLVLAAAEVPGCCLILVFSCGVRRPEHDLVGKLIAAFNAAPFVEPHMATLTIADDGGGDVRLTRT